MTPGTGGERAGGPGPAPAGREGPAADASAGDPAVHRAEAAAADHLVPESAWRGLPRALLRVRRLVLLAVLLPLAAATGLLLGLLVAPALAALAALPLLLAAWCWTLLERNWRSWRYAERADDLLISRGVLWHELTAVPYGRMQLVEVASGPLERRFGLASVQLHTAAAATDARIPGLEPAEAARLRDRLTELGQTRSAGL